MTSSPHGVREIITHAGPTDSDKKYSFNRWIFKTSTFSPTEEKATDCYGPRGSCPFSHSGEKGKRVAIADDKLSVVPYFNWLDDSFLLLAFSSSDNTLTPFSAHYEYQLHGLLREEEVVAVSDLVLPLEGRALLMIEYAKFPALLVGSFRKKKRREISDIAIVQYSSLPSLASDEGRLLAPELIAALSYLPPRL